MNRFTTLTLAVAAAITLTTSSCKKGDDSVPPSPGPVDNTPAFVGRNLVMTSFQINPAIDMDGDGKLDSDLMVFLRDCDKDNTIVFEKSGKLSGSNGQLSCSDDTDADPSTVKASHWTYNAQTKTIQIVDDKDPSDVSEWNVVEASASGMKVEISVSEPSRSYKTIMTWKAI